MANYLVFPDDAEQGAPKFFTNLSKAKQYALTLALERNLNVRVWKENLKTGIMTRAATIRPAYSRKKNPISTLSDWTPCHAIRTTPDGKVEVLREKNPGKGAWRKIGELMGGVGRGVRKVGKRLGVNNPHDTPFIKRKSSYYDVYDKNGNWIDSVEASSKVAAKRKAGKSRPKYLKPLQVRLS